MKIKKLSLHAIVSVLACIVFINPGYTQVTVSNFNNQAVTQGAAPIQLAPSITVTSAESFSDSYMEFSYASGGNRGEILSFVKVSAPDITNGVISVVGNNIYLGDGTKAVLVAYIDADYDGDEGNPLRVNFASPLVNADFTDEVTNDVIPGWTANLGTITLGALASRTQGNPITSTGSGPYTISGPGYSFQSDVHYGVGSFEAGWLYEGVERPSGTTNTSVEVVDDTGAYGGRALHLKISGSVTSPNGSPPKYGTHFGPEAWSEPFDAETGDLVKLSYKAVRISDHYECYGFIVDTLTNAHTLVLYGKGANLDWTEATGTVPADGTYRFRFVNGTYDGTGGFAVGSDMWIDRVRVTNKYSVASLVEGIAQSVTYQNNCGLSASRTIDFKARTISGTIGTASATITVTTINLPPLVAGHTTSGDETICYDSPPSLLTAVAPTGGGTTDYDYQWQNATDGVNFTDIPYADELTYQPGDITDTTYYRLLQLSYCETVSTDTIKITTLPQLISGALSPSFQQTCENTLPLPIVVQPPSGGATSNYAYQWQSSTDYINYTDLVGDTTLTYQPPSTLPFNQYTSYRLRIVESCDTIYSTIAWIYPSYPELVAGTVSVGQLVCGEGTPAEITATPPTGGGTTTYMYQWQNSADNINFSDISGATNLNYQPPSTTTGTNYYRQVQYTTYCTVFTDTLSISLYPTFVVGSISGDQTLCGNAVPAGFIGVAPSGGDGNYTYQWQSSTDDITYTDITGATSLNYQAGDLTGDTYFRLVQTSACGSLTTNKITITLYPDFVAGTLTADEAICYNTIPGELSGTAPSGGEGTYTYQWQSSTDNITFTDITGEMGLTYQPGALMQTTYYRILQTSGCGTVETNVVTITVYPEFAVGSISLDQDICYGTVPEELTGVAPTGTDGSYSYQWQMSTDGTNFSDIAGAASLNYQPGTLTATTYYQLVQTSTFGCGEETTNSVMINVYPEFVVGSIVGNQTICYDTAPEKLMGVAPTGANGNYAYQWQSSTDGTNFTDITGATGLDYQPGDLTGTTYFRLVQRSTYGCGELITDQLTVTVRPVVAHPAIVEKKLPGHVSLLVVDNSNNLYFEYLWTYADGSPLPSDLVDDRQFLTLPLEHMNASYMVTAFDRDMCGASSPTVQVTPQQMLSTIYPTITKNNFTMNVAGPENGTVNVSIFSDAGQLIKTLQFNKNITIESKEISVNELKSGSYLVEVFINDYKEVHRIFVR